jgi:hypothetical protein
MWGRPFRAAAGLLPGASRGREERLRSTTKPELAFLGQFRREAREKAGLPDAPRGARRSARGGVLEQYVERGEQAQRRKRGLIARRSRSV